jgi:hypothetical protein
LLGEAGVAIAEPDDIRDFVSSLGDFTELLGEAFEDVGDALDNANIAPPCEVRSFEIKGNLRGTIQYTVVYKLGDNDPSSIQGELLSFNNLLDGIKDRFLEAVKNIF